MKDLFGQESDQQVGTIKYDDYEAFVSKFQAKKTTDDCYTPPAVFDAILAYVRANCDLDGKRIVRPFVPNGDYKALHYEIDDVVIDNPPFSIISEII